MDKENGMDKGGLSYIKLDKSVIWCLVREGCRHSFKDTVYTPYLLAQYCNILHKAVQHSPVSGVQLWKQLPISECFLLVRVTTGQAQPPGCVILWSAGDDTVRCCCSHADTNTRMLSWSRDGLEIITPHSRPLVDIYASRIFFRFLSRRQLCLM